MNILGRVQPNEPNDDFLTEEQMQESGNQPMGKPKSNPNAYGGGDLMKLLGGIGKPSDKPLGEDRPNGDWQYTNSDEMTTNYIPISKTYKPLKYEGPIFEPSTYEPPTYEPASQMLFGEQGKSWEDSPVFKDTGIGKMLQERGDHKSVFDEDKELKGILFGKGEEPIVQEEKANGWFENTNPVVTPVSNQMPTPMPTQVPSMAEIMARVNLPQIPNVPTVYTPPMPQPIMPTQPIYNRPQPLQVPMQQDRRQGGRPKGSKNRPPPGGPAWAARMSQTK